MIIRCLDCHHYSFGPNSPDNESGECRINPPVISPTGATAFPLVQEEWWCGKFIDNVDAGLKEFDTPPVGAVQQVIWHHPA